MMQSFSVPQDNYDIPAILCLPCSDSADSTGHVSHEDPSESFYISSDTLTDEALEKYPAVILCHGTGSHKDEVGNMFLRLAEALAQHGIASVRFDFAGCGDSQALQQDLTFWGEVRDTLAVYETLRNHPAIDPERIGILGFSQGARVMAQFLCTVTDRQNEGCLSRHSSNKQSLHPISTAVSWSGACHDGPGVFAGWYPSYYDEAVKNGYAAIPMGWRKDLLVSQLWFDEIQNTTPMEGFSQYPGPVLAIAGREDPVVPCGHAQEILSRCRHPHSRALILPGADHTFCVLTEDQTLADQVLRETVTWLCDHL